MREGLEETVTVLTLGLSPRLQRSLATTNAAESLISRTRHVKRNVKRWRGGQMMLRWVAAGVLEAAKGFRRLSHAALTFRIGAGQRWSPERDAVRRPTQTTGAALLARETDLVEELLLPFVRALELLERGAVLPPRVTGLYEP